MRVFVDTSAILAFVSRMERHHAAALAWMGESARHGRLVASTDVFDEVITRFRRIEGHGRAVALGRAIRDGSFLDVVPVTDEDREAAWRLFEARDAVKLSFTDCTSVAVMERLGLSRIFTFDDDFRKLGLDVVP